MDVVRVARSKGTNLIGAVIVPVKRIAQRIIAAGRVLNDPDMIHSIDDDGNIVYTNRTAEKLLGYTRKELLTMNIRQVYADEVMEAVERGFSDLKECGDKLIPESLLKAKDGTRIPVEIRSFSIYDDEGT